ncbi:MAG: hypothetical protein ACRCXM_08910 [Beijerinckiaceae bacterium]
MSGPDTQAQGASAALQANRLLQQKPKIINVGLDGFADELAQQGVAVVRVAWTPPAGGDAKLARLLSKLGV